MGKNPSGYPLSVRSDGLYNNSIVFLSDSYCFYVCVTRNSSKEKVLKMPWVRLNYVLTVNK